MDPFIAQIVMFGGNFAPRGWAFCDGQLLPISQNTALFSIIGTMYGGDGRTTFGLPDLRGRVPIHPGNGPGLSSYRQGQKGGTEANRLTIQNMPAMNVSIPVSTEDADSDEASGKFLANGQFYHNSAGGTYGNGPVNVNGTGSSTDVNNVQPYGTVQFIIALQGVFPSRS
jgi:microcystin-dependent protein